MWWLLPVEFAQTLAVLHAVSGVIICLIFDDLVPQKQPSYVPRKRRGCSNRMHKVFLGILSQCCDSLEACIKNLKVRRRYHPPRLYYTGQRTKRKKGKYTMQTDITGMTTTWENERNAPSGSFDSDSQALMLDDGASACITNNFKDFTDPPKWADRKVKGIKGHAQATHRGTVKWYIEDDHGLVHVMIINGAYLTTGQRSLSHRRRDWGIDDQQEHHVVLGPEAFHKNSPARPQDKCGINHDCPRRQGSPLLLCHRHHTRDQTNEYLHHTCHTG